MKTSWSKLDDNFYEARGYTWTLLEQLKAFQRDFGPILRNKRAEWAAYRDQVTQYELDQYLGRL